MKLFTFSMSIINVEITPSLPSPSRGRVRVGVTLFIPVTLIMTRRKLFCALGSMWYTSIIPLTRQSFTPLHVENTHPADEKRPLMVSGQILILTLRRHGGMPNQPGRRLWIPALSVVNQGIQGIEQSQKVGDG